MSVPDTSGALLPSRKKGVERFPEAKVALSPTIRSEEVRFISRVWADRLSDDEFDDWVVQ